jgi:hypothetical protein
VLLIEPIRVHPIRPYPGKQQVVAECMDDIEDRWSRGLLTLEQRVQLCAILLREMASRLRDHPPATAV